MENVAHCVRMLRDLFQSIQENKPEKTQEIANEISRMEHLADITKVEIRNRLPKGTYLPVDRTEVLEILTIQDRLADTAEDISRLTTLRSLTIPTAFQKEFFGFLAKNLEAFETAHRIIREWQDLVESSIGKIEVERMGVLIDQVAYQEHEADLLQHSLLKIMYQEENGLPFEVFYLWQNIIRVVSGVSNLSENLANHVRILLEWR